MTTPGNTDDVPSRDELTDPSRMAREMRAMFEVIPDSLVFAGPDRRITRVNRKFTDIFGYTKDEVVGRTTKFLYANPKDYEQTGRLRYNRKAGDDLEPYRCEYRRRDGSVFLGETTGVHVRNRAGETLGYLGITRDVTDVANLEQKRRVAEASQRRSEQLLRETGEMAGIGAGEYDARTGEFIWSEQLFRIYDLPPGPPPTLDEALSYLDRDDALVLDRLMNRALQEGEGFEAEVPMTTHLGRRKWLHVKARPILEDGEIVGVRGFSRDITDQKQSEEAKREFISVVSHELRTPLTAVHGGLSLLDSGAVGALSDEPKEIVEIALRNTTRLSNMIDEILDIQKIESGTVDFQLVDVHPSRLIDDVTDEYAQLARQRNIVLEARCETGDMLVKVDPAKMHRALMNLVSNAVKFSPEGESVEISATLLDEQTIRFAVRDRGPGIPSSFHDELFEPFSQVDPHRNPRFRGTGLGLHIAKEIVERMDGSIDFETALHEGTTMYIDLPAADGLE